MDRTAIWPLIDPVFYALSEAVGAEVAPAFIASGFQGLQWWIAHQAWVFSDEPFTARTLHRRMPFVAPALLDDAILDLLADRLFQQVEEGVYQLTAKGFEVVPRLLGVLYEAIAGLKPMPADTSERLAWLLHRTVESILAAPEPPAKSTTITTHQRQWPGRDAHALIRIRCDLDTLRAYRCDCYNAVWPGYEAAPPEWDAFETIAGTKGLTAAALTEQLAPLRAYPPRVYRRALDALAERGWVVISGDSKSYILTREGQRLRREAQGRVDDLFLRPLSVLTDDEAAELVTLLKRLCHALRT